MNAFKGTPTKALDMMQAHTRDEKEEKEEEKYDDDNDGDADAEDDDEEEEDETIRSAFELIFEEKVDL